MEQKTIVLDRFFSSGWGEGYYPFGLLSRCYTQSRLSLREAVYYHAARAQPHEAKGENLLSAIDAAFVQLYKQNTAVSAIEKEQRGNLSRSPIRQIIVLGDALPDTSAPGFLETIQRLELNKVGLVFALYRHEYLSDSQSDLLRGRAAAIRELNLEQVEVLDADSAEELRNEIVPQLISLSRDYVIRS